ncbi:MAG TPA: hypothetical protein VNF68_10940 [Candidatus Baltobacteraceae bacterium]|nr:hypothetical protein [Candidatus Baltobacteraceae bacterium]
MSDIRKRLHSLLAGAALAATAIVVVAAPASAIVLNNGLIIVHNSTDVPVVVKMLTPSGHEWEGTTLAPGHTFATQRCCYAAGSEYRLYVLHKGPGTKYGGMDNNIYFKPALCNRNGIPYGFAEFNVTDHNVNRTYTKCYEGPL